MKKVVKIVIGSVICIALIAAFLQAAYYFTYKNSKEYQVDNIANSDSSIEMSTVSSVLIEFRPLTSELTSFYFYPTDVTEETMLTIYYCILDPRTAEVVQMQQVEGIVTGETYEIKLDFENTKENPMNLEPGALYDLIIRFNRPYGQQEMSFLTTHSMDGHIVPKYIIDQRKQTGLMCCKFVFADRDAAIQKVMKKIGIVGGILLFIIVFVNVCKKTCFVGSKEYFLSDGPVRLSVIRLVGYLLFFLSTFFGQADLTELSISLLVASLITVIAGYVLDVVYMVIKKATADKYSRKYSAQALTVYCLLLLFVISATVSPSTPKDYMNIIVLEYVTLVLGIAFWCVNIGKVKLSGLAKVCKSNIGLFVVLAIAFVLSLSTVWHVPVCDDVEYLRHFATQADWNFTMSQSHYMDLCGHLTGSAILFAMIGLFLGNGTYISIKLVQIIVLLISVICVYAILMKVIKSKKASVLGTAMFVAYPLLFGCLNISPDFFATMFVIWLVASYCLELEVLMTFTGVLLCFSKEPLVVVYTGFCIGLYLYKTIVESKNSKRLIVLGALRLSDYFRLGVPPVAWILIYKAKSIISYLGKDVGTSIAWGTTTRQSEAGITEYVAGGLGHFGFEPDYFFKVLAQELVIDYTWIFTVLVLALFFISLIKRKKYLAEYLYLFVPVLFAILGGTAINCLFVTFNVTRYKTPETVLILILGVVSAYALELKNKIKERAAYCIIVLMIIQQFFTSDPFTRMTGTMFSTGRAIISNLDFGESIFIFTNAQYNRQGYTYGNFIQKVLRTIDCDENTIVYSPGVRADYDYEFFGPISYTKTYYYYNRDNKKVNDYNLNGPVGMDVLYGELLEDGSRYVFCPDERKQNLDECDRIYLLVQPYEEPRMSDSFIENAGYSVVSSQEVSYATWKGTLYELNKL